MYRVHSYLERFLENAIFWCILEMSSQTFLLFILPDRFIQFKKYIAHGAYIYGIVLYVNKNNVI